jgi:hypothetical protein
MGEGWILGSVSSAKIIFHISNDRSFLASKYALIFNKKILYFAQNATLS